MRIRLDLRVCTLYTIVLVVLLCSVVVVVVDLCCCCLLNSDNANPSASKCFLCVSTAGVFVLNRETNE